MSRLFFYFIKKTSEMDGKPNTTYGQPDMSPRALYARLTALEERMSVLEERLEGDDTARKLLEELSGASQIVSEITGKE